MRLGLLESVTQLNSHALHLRVALFLLKILVLPEAAAVLVTFFRFTTFIASVHGRGSYFLPN
ncbi:hypothetical protein VCSRO67_3064 [Vibrio cholerae]|nr:hypothetical protein VCSRO67_3064 [Vibrio cholerae]